MQRHQTEADLQLQPVSFQEVTDYLQAKIEMGRLPGAVLAIGSKDHLYLQQAIGFAQTYPQQRLMQQGTLFDLASLTKVVATLPSVMILADRGEIRLDEPVSRYFPDFSGKGKEQVTIRQLLTHTAGLPASADFYSSGQSPEEIRRRLFQTELACPAGQEVIYSDLGFMILGFLVEKVSGSPLDQFARQQVFEPLGMPDTCFNPPEAAAVRTAATEYRSGLGRYQCAEVHDENATALGGVSGHAGLFSTVADLTRYARCFLQEGRLGSFQLLKPETAAEMACLQTAGLNGSRGLGWVVYRASDETFGGGFETDGYGHTGFTGTSLYLNPSMDLFVVLLTNRVHYGRTPDILEIRKTAHQLIASVVKKYRDQGDK